MKKYKIADIVIDLDCAQNLIHQNLKTFEWKEQEEAQLYWSVHGSDSPVIPNSVSWTELAGFCVGRFEDKVYVYYPLEDIYLIRWIVYEDNFSKATFYFNSGSLHNLSKERSDELIEYLFAFCREAFFLGALYMDGISIHSASLIYKGKGIVFSARSQTGKSTHTNRWKERFGTPILDGDVTVCRCLEDGIFVYGLPWSGTSGLFLNEKVELEALVFLKQGPRNIVSTMKIYEAFQQLFSRSFTPLWDSLLAQQRMKLTEAIIKRIPQIYLMECLPDSEAVDVIKKEIDVNWKS